MGFFVHPKAMCDSKLVGDRTRIWAFSHVLEGAKIGEDCNICENVFIEGEVVIGNHVTVKNGVQLYNGVKCEDYVFIGPNATFTNDVQPRSGNKDFTLAPTLLKKGCSVGANATIVAGVTIGEYAMVGAGTVVIGDVLAHALVVGNPARQIGWICQCGARIISDKCTKIGCTLKIQYKFDKIFL